jgi:hypothetical protein
VCNPCTIDTNHISEGRDCAADWRLVLDSAPSGVATVRSDGAREVEAQLENAAILGDRSRGSCYGQEQRNDSDCLPKTSRATWGVVAR